MLNSRKNDSGLAQNAAFIRGAYRKAVFAGMLSILSVNINIFVDGILVGRRIGSDALAAINLSLPLYLALCVVGSFIAAGTGINASRAIGVGDAGKRDAFFRAGFNSAVLASLIITAGALLLRRPLVAFLCSDDAISGYVMQYAVITLIGALPKILIYIPFWYLRLDGKNADVAIMMAGMAAINIALDIVFVYFLDMGVFGAGLASVIATAIACAYGVIRLLGKDSPYTWRFELMSLKDWKGISSAGFPSAFNNLCATIRLLIINSMLLSFGGGRLVAVFSAVNGIWGFGECVTLGAPNAGSAMLGVFGGEHDNGSCRLLLKEEWKTGCAAGIVFLILCAALSPVVPAMYGLKGENVLLPLMWMALSVFPALLMNIFTTYYNISGRNIWSGAMIFVHVIASVYVSLLLVRRLGLSVFSFLLISELLTAAFWLIAVFTRRARRPGRSLFLFYDIEDELSGKVLNFSVSSDVAEIVSASERIGGFCEANGMSVRDTMRLQMSMEEVMTLIREVNGGDGALRFDLRAYSFENESGIRISYNGRVFNPFGFKSADTDAEDRFMGVKMIYKMVEAVNYRRAFGVNTLQIVLKENK